MFDLKTVNDIFVKATSRGDKEVMRWQQGKEGAWNPITSTDLYGRVRALADVLRSWGIGKGDRVLILSENRWEWAVMDFAALAIGAVDVPLYATLTADQIAYMINNSGAKAVFVSTKEQYKKIAAMGDLPSVEHVVVMDTGKFENAENFADLMAGAVERQARNAEFDALLASAKPDDVATIIYTSGTTGVPKGVMLTHGNLASNVNVSTDGFGFTDKDSVISFLPLSHVTARHVDYALMCHGAFIAYCPSVNQLPNAMKVVKPTIFMAVPRVYEKIRQGVEGKSNSSPVKAKILAWALAVGRRHREQILAGRKPVGPRWLLANALVFSKIREAFGGGAKFWISGGAPLGMDTAGWFADAGIRIFEGYGMTETSPVVAANVPGAHCIGTVGKTMPNIEVRLAEDGELELRGPSVFIGYWQQEKETAEAFTEDGFYKTGDIAQIDKDGYLSITDRKKELLKTSGGKLIAPQPIENKLKANVLVAQAALVGDKHKFASVLISPNFDALKSWAKQNGVSATDNTALVKDPKVIEVYKGIMQQVNGSLAHYEAMKRLTVVPDEWAIETGELTPSMKLKRRVIQEKYAKEIAAFYSDEATAKE
jgi:long-chain acyl-CoA synthetase